MPWWAKILAVKIPGVSEKKYGVADYWYLTKGNIQQCNLFRCDNIYKSKCIEVSSQLCQT